MIIIQENGDAVLDLGKHSSSQVKKWETWFMTPMGLMDNLPDAVNRMIANDLPLHVIRPVPVAISCDNNYEAVI